MEKDILTFRGDRNVWIDFVSKVKKDRKEVWEVLSKLISKYIKNKRRSPKSNSADLRPSTHKADGWKIIRPMLEKLQWSNGSFFELVFME